MAVQERMVSPAIRKLGLLIAGRAISFLQFTGLRLIGWDFWTFIPKGDMPRWTCVILEVLDRVGRMCRLGACPGGLILTATRETSDDAFDLALVHIRNG